jgi:hypothetical protein
MNLGREEHVDIWYKLNYEPARCAYSSGIDLKFDWTHFLRLGKRRQRWTPRNARRVHNVHSLLITL